MVKFCNKGALPIHFITNFYIYSAISAIIVAVMVFFAIKDVVQKKPFGGRFVISLWFTVVFGCLAIFKSLSSIPYAKEVLAIDGGDVLLNVLIRDEVGVSISYLIISLVSLFIYIAFRKKEADRNPEADNKFGA
ncbi:hypothetical protein LCM20_09605 [Halobacillus litoralis]|uniref:hypothetical protein n=1 Tax=Halobacillus litoralis TaxID=45668 RepID=UPI001CD1F6C2|nr:hypothetical protein [Halobacillus litoralis]MCA0970845.1 hypothetical protein [Halobacillus litoralis]